MSQENIIHIENLTKSFGDHLVLKDVSLAIPKGAVTALIGPSASGKSVLLKCLLGLYPIDSGSVSIEGQNTSKLNRKNKARLMDRIGVLFQQNALFDSLTIWENVCFRPISNKSLSRKQAYEKAIEILGKVGLKPETALLFPSDLSGGMQKRVGLARAIASEADFLILDDPTAGLDPILSLAITNLIQDLVKRTNATALVVTGDMTDLEKRYSHIALLHDKIIQWQGPSNEAKTSNHQALIQMLNGDKDGPIRMKLREAS
ncbi:ABC transporter ATP-binding protein [Curvivirga sp.]|uniref:ABC transporter ATP-binding protein n=1 Tax=Curvivirga sp. TaxID=2856848 RepID=UPI003B58E790